MSPLQLPIRKLGSVETSVCSPSCTYCHPDTRSPLGCLCCSGAAYKAPGILLVPVPAVQPLSVLRTERTAGIRPCSSRNILATIPKHHLWGKFTAQVPTSWLPQTLAVLRFPKTSMWEVSEIKSPHLGHGTCPSARPWGAATQSNMFPCTKLQGKSLSCCMAQQKGTARPLPSL